jgi:uncharacterized protein
LILPDVEDTDTAGFWVAAAERRLVVQRCDACGQLRFPPHPYCEQCSSNLASWSEVSGEARLWSYVVVHSPTLAAFAEFVPFPVAVVELAEGKHLRMTGNVVTGPEAAINSVNPQRLKIGAPMRVIFRKVHDEVTLPSWRLVSE